MWPTRTLMNDRIFEALGEHSNTVRNLPGVALPEARRVLALQFSASARREDYYRIVAERKAMPERANPNSTHFDAERAVTYYIQSGQIDEAYWLLFLMTYFARPADTGWLRLKDFYGMLGAGTLTWKTVYNNPEAVLAWLNENWTSIRGKFGNHRKYESLDPNSTRCFRLVIKSYLDWIGGDSQAKFFSEFVRNSGNDPHAVFDKFYTSLRVFTFGRLAKFDYLSLLGRYGLIPAVAGSAYLSGATGPKRGVKLLFLGDPLAACSIRSLQKWLDELDQRLGLGMAIMEDALCNWQKSPTVFVHYKG